MKQSTGLFHLPTPPPGDAVTSGYGASADSDTDFHRADETPLRAHWERLQPRRSAQRKRLGRVLLSTPQAVGAASDGPPSRAAVPISDAWINRSTCIHFAMPHRLASLILLSLLLLAVGCTTSSSTRNVQTLPAFEPVQAEGDGLRIRLTRVLTWGEPTSEVGWLECELLLENRGRWSWRSLVAAVAGASPCRGQCTSRAASHHGRGTSHRHS